MRAAEMHSQQAALKHPCRDQNQNHNQATLKEHFLQKCQDSVGCHESVNLTAACRLLDQIIHMDMIIWRKAPKCISHFMQIRGLDLKSDTVAECV